MTEMIGYQLGRMEESVEEPLHNSFNTMEIDTGKTGESIDQLVFTKVGHYYLLKMARSACPEELCDDTIRRYKKEFKKRIFQIQVSSKTKTWILRKRFEDFVELGKKMKDKFRKKVPHIPVKKETDSVDFELLLDFFVILLGTACKIKKASDDPDLLAFLYIPIVPSRRKLKTYVEMQSKKRSGGRYNEASCRGCVALFTNWKKRFFTVSTEGVFYSPGHTEQDSQIKQMLLFSYDFMITYGLAETGHKWGINLNSCQRILHIKTDSWYDFCLFILAVKMALKENGYLESNRFDSFAPLRQNCETRYYIDGENYFKAIHDEISNAKTEVFIAGWMITPYYLLCRPNSINSDFRFDRLLVKVAKRGVKVHIIVFLQPKLALNNDSEHTKQYLQSLDPNIKVLRHPPYILIPFLWSHHEKIVIVDQRIGFIGGLDICYGRFDNSNHQLSDLQGEEKYWQGADYCNLRISDVYTPRQYLVSMLNRNIDPRLPWHDVAVQLRGDSVIDLSRHFIQYWNFVNFQTKFNSRQLLIQVGIVSTTQEEKQMMQQEMEDKIKMEQVRCKLRQDIRNLDGNKNSLPVVLEEPLSSDGPPIPDLRIKRSVSAAVKLSPFTSKFQASRQMSAKYQPDNLHHLDQIYSTNQKEKIFYKQHLMKEEERRRQEGETNKLEEIMEQKLDWIKKGLVTMNPLADHEPENPDIVLAGLKTVTKGKMFHQILRSSSSWGLGLKDGLEERSIYKSFISLIAHAKEYIYIESQFFICVENHLAEAIRQRIQTAVKLKHKFKVIVVLPLLPAFEGEISDSAATVLKVQLHWQYQTICRGGHSLLEKLSHIQNIDEYIQFYCLRTHGMIGDRPVTEIVYVHSKLMIVDDNVVQIGSANINDRSLLGTRDSEIGILIQDQEEMQVQRNGVTVKVKRFPYLMRVDLFMEHFGLTKDEACRLMHDDDIWWLVKERANKNTALYREIFAVYPDDAVKQLSDLAQFQASKDVSRYDLLKELIKGNVVQFPKDFLKHQNLKPRPSQKEYYIPQISFT